MAKSTADTIPLRHNEGGYVQFERVAAGTITPGDLLELTTNNEVQRHSTAEGVAPKWFAKENDLVGEEISDDYAANDTVLIIAARQGDVIQANLSDGENVSQGDFLESDGAGRLQKFAQESGSLQEFPIAMALEAVDLSGSSAADPSFRINVLII